MGGKRTFTTERLELVASGDPLGRSHQRGGWSKLYCDRRKERPAMERALRLTGTDWPLTNVSSARLELRCTDEIAS